MIVKRVTGMIVLCGVFFAMRGTVNAAYFVQEAAAYWNEDRIAARVTTGATTYVFEQLEDALKSNEVLGGTVELLKDASLDSSFTVYDHDQSVALDLGGHTLTIRKRWMICSDMTIFNGTIVSEGVGFRPLLSTQCVTLRDVTLTAAAGYNVFVGCPGGIVIEEGVTIADEDSAAVNGKCMCGVVIRGGRFKGKHEMDVALIERREGFVAQWSEPDADGFVTPQWARDAAPALAPASLSQRDLAAIDAAQMCNSLQEQWALEVLAKGTL